MTSSVEWYRRFVFVKTDAAHAVWKGYIQETYVDLYLNGSKGFEERSARKMIGCNLTKKSGSPGKRSRGVKNKILNLRDDKSGKQIVQWELRK